jgi:pimeloyl-ACP methyl ester carboxylesterase
MADFVLVHGAWHGAWCWKLVLPLLWGGGHRAFAVSLSGVGERAHLGTREIGLNTHIADVEAVIEAEELNAAILVGHSYGGIVITGVAARLPGRLSHLVYVDAVVPRPGEAWSSGHSSETQTGRRESIRVSGVIPPPDPLVYGLTGAERDWVARRQTPQPGGTYDARLQFDPQGLAALPRTFIDCTHPALPTIAETRKRVRSEAGWHITELETGHDPMISAPAALVAALEWASREGSRTN